MAVAPQFVLLGPQGLLGQVNLGYAGLALLPLPTNVVRTVSHTVTFAGVVLDDALHSQIQLGFNVTSGSATVLVRQKPATGAEGDAITIEGGTLPSPPGTVATRFVGTVERFDTDSFPRACGLICKDQLFPLEKYLQPDAAGLDLTAITGSPTARADEIVTSVLGIVGVAFSAANIANTGRVLGTIAPEQFKWKHPTTARAYIDDILRNTTPGFRLFQSGDGQIYLAQIIGRPQAAASFSLIEGYNVVGQTSGSRGTEDRRTGVHVTGYDDGKGNGAVFYDVPANSATEPQAELSSSKIETTDHAQEMGDYLLQELDREFVRTRSCTTPSDDILGPGQTHVLLLPRNEITEPAWCQSLTITIGNDFRQTPGHIGGGLP